MPVERLSYEDIGQLCRGKHPQRPPTERQPMFQRRGRPKMKPGVNVASLATASGWADLASRLEREDHTQIYKQDMSYTVLKSMTWAKLDQRVGELHRLNSELECKLNEANHKITLLEEQRS
jgi:hypothetical protein